MMQTRGVDMPDDTPQNSKWGVELAELSRERVLLYARVLGPKPLA